MRAAVDDGGLADLLRHLLEEAAHQPDHERERDGPVDEDQAPIGVYQVEVAEHDQERDDDDDRREHPQLQDLEREQLATGAEACEALVKAALHKNSTAFEGAVDR